MVEEIEEEKKAKAFDVEAWFKQNQKTVLGGVAGTEVRSGGCSGFGFRGELDPVAVGVCSRRGS